MVYSKQNDNIDEVWNVKDRKDGDGTWEGRGGNLLARTLNEESKSMSSESITQLSKNKKTCKMKKKE